MRGFKDISSFVRGVVAVAAMLFSSVMLYAQEPGRTDADFELGRATEILANIMREFDTGYVDEVSVDVLLENASAGLVVATDPYSEYLSEKSMEEFEVLTTGKYGGVGSLIRKRGDYVIFAQPYKGSPADVGGVKIGDKILAINGEDMKGVDVAAISSRLKGDPETDVTVVVERNIDASRDTLTLKRRRISMPSVSYAGVLRDGVGYISHNDFIEGSYDEVRHALEAMMAQDSLRGLILDYRSNGGGVMQEAVNIVSLFVPRDQRVVSIMGRDSSSLKHYVTKYAPLAESLPIVVLVNGSSASASEILAGALQDMDRGVVMGQRTYGKGLVQGTRHVGYNTFLKYTTAKYYIPSGRCIQAVNYSKRRVDGSVESVPDSLIKEYRTRGGRLVYDGGGIVPDVKHEPQYVSRFAVTLYTMGYMEDWADEYMRRHAGEDFDLRTFSITDADYADFVEFIRDKEVPYESETRRALKALERALENDLYDEHLGEALEGIKAQVKDDKMSNMETYRREIIDALNTEIVLRYAYREGAIEYSALRDEEVEAAIELLLNGEEYNRILREQDLDMH
ncbi:MAG: S41 family peptidase [Alistipes sp.]|nr:S41 family peptidase [Alistipes sp.]